MLKIFYYLKGYHIHFYYLEDFIIIKKYSCISSCHSLAIANDDSFVISGHLDGTIKLWSSNEKPEKIFDLHEDKITSLEILKNENLMFSISKYVNLSSSNLIIIHIFYKNFFYF